MKILLKNIQKLHLANQILEIIMTIQIFATLQRPITANISENQISCYEKPCKINLDFDPIFSADFPKKDFSCEVHIAGKKFQTCNPPATEITSESDILVKISRKNSK